MSDRRVFNQIQNGAIRDNLSEGERALSFRLKQLIEKEPQPITVTDQKRKVLQPLEEKNAMPRKQLTPLEKPDEADV